MNSMSSSSRRLSSSEQLLTSTRRLTPAKSRRSSASKRRQERAGRKRAGAEGGVAHLLAAKEIDVALERCGLEQQLARALENEGAGSRRRDLGAAIEQPQAELGLGRLDASCQRRLTQMHLLGGPCEVARLGDGDDVRQPFEIHGDASGSIETCSKMHWTPSQRRFDNPRRG